MTDKANETAGADETAPANKTRAAAAPAQPPAKSRDTSKDIGKWKYEPWKGIPRWVHPNGRDSFNETEVRKLKKL